MPKKPAYCRKGETTRDAIEKRRAEFLKLTSKKNLTSGIKKAVSDFNASRGIVDGGWQKIAKTKSKPLAQTPIVAKEAPVNQWVSRGVQPALPSRYHAKSQEMQRLAILTNAREIVAAARAKGLVYGGGKGLNL